MRVPRNYGLGPEVTGGVRDAITLARSGPVGGKGSPTLPPLPDLDSNQEMHRCTRINSPPRCHYGLPRKVPVPQRSCGSVV